MAAMNTNALLLAFALFESGLDADAVGDKWHRGGPSVGMIQIRREMVAEVNRKLGWAWYRWPQDAVAPLRARLIFEDWLRLVVPRNTSAFDAYCRWAADRDGPEKARKPGSLLAPKAAKVARKYRELCALSDSMVEAMLRGENGTAVAEQ